MVRKRTRTQVVIVAGIAGLLVAAAAVGMTSATTRDKSTHQLSEGRILGIATTAAARAGDPTPTLIQHGAGTRHDAVLVGSGAIVPDTRWSYLIAIRGHFVFKYASRPAGAKAPHGSVLTLIVSAKTGRVTDAGVSNRYPNLSRLGTVHTDLRRLAGVTRRETFLSLWPACACGRRTELDAFSLRTGRRVVTLTQVPVTFGEQVSAPAAVPGRPILLTFSSGPKCATSGGGGASSGPCVPVADSCAGRVQRIDPLSGSTTTLLRFAPSTLVTDATPSPKGNLLVMRSGDCQTSYFDLHLVVRDRTTGRQWAIGADAPRCHEIAQASWNSAGSRLVFPYGPSILPYGTKPSADQSCTAPRFNRLAVVRADRPSSSRAWKLIEADRQCTFMAAAFDRQGIAAVEGCQHGPHGFTVEPFLGYAYVVQLDHRNRVTARLHLKPGWEGGRVSTEFRDGRVLISQDQPANAGYPERDWVWQFDGRHLRLVAHYAANDAAQVLAVPW